MFARHWLLAALFASLFLSSFADRAGPAGNMLLLDASVDDGYGQWIEFPDSAGMDSVGYRATFECWFLSNNGDRPATLLSFDSTGVDINKSPNLYVIGNKIRVRCACLVVPSLG